jgi:hypothetical protein
MVLEKYLPVSIYELIPTVLLPFLLTFTIFFAVLTLTRRFSRNVNFILALVFTFLAGYAGLFTWISTWIAKSIAYVAIAIFGIVFVFGSLAWGFGKTKEAYYKFLSPEERLKKLLEKREKLLDEAAEARERGDENKYRARMEELKRIELEIELASRIKK